MAFMTIDQLRTILITETDADSPGSQELMDQLRENFETLLMLHGYAGFIGTVRAPEQETIVTHTDAAQDVDEHNGRTLMIVSGDAIGNLYTIDDTAAQTITCTGDTLTSDGVAIGDTFMVFYDLKPASPTGHSHNGVDSSELGISLKGGGLDTGTASVAPGAPIAQAAGVDIDLLDYMFFPNLYVEREADCYMTGYSSEAGGNDGRFGLYNTAAGNTCDWECTYRYINVASAPMIWVTQIKATGEIEHVATYTSHPHKKRPKNFIAPMRYYSFDSNGKRVYKDMSYANEIAMFNYPEGEFNEIINKFEKDYRGKTPRYTKGKFLTKDYEYDTKKKIFKPKNLLSI